ncbi:hypothetical protein [Actinoplanes sp. CA-252034]|uniref:hypothetical protein n=1 Tax=Actinoplanes sp. CA-252034 TaxID=3239906 RepID=UPI003D976092
MASRTVGKLARAMIVSPDQMNLLGAPADLLRSALQPGFRDERYKRLWRLSRTREQSGFVYGHLGFESQSEADLWADDEQEFEPAEVPNGAASPFVIRLKDLTMVFQTRRQDIRVASFISAFQAMLRTIDKNKQWRLEPLTGKMSFHNWRREMEKISRVRFKIKKEDPQPSDGGLVSLMLQCKPDLAALELRAKDGIEVSGDLMRELLQHAESGYGELVAVGRRKDNPASERIWVSTLEGESVVSEVPIDPETGEATFETLMAELGNVERPD